MAKAKGRKYSKAEKRAYWMGFGQGLQKEGKEMLPYGVNPETNSSYSNGYDRGRKADRKSIVRHLSMKVSKKKKVSNPKPRTAPFTTDKKGRINGYNPKYPHKEPDLFIEDALIKRELF